MIMLTRLSGSVFALNADLIERIDSTPDTVVTLVDGKKYVVAEGLDEVVDAGPALSRRDHRPEQPPTSTMEAAPTPAQPTPRHRRPPSATPEPARGGADGPGNPDRRSSCGLVIIVVANVMEGGNPMSLLLLPPMLLVFGTTLMVTVAGGTLAGRQARDRARSRRPSPARRPRPATLVPTVVALAEKARREGLLALEDGADARSTTPSWSRASPWPSTAPTPRSSATSSRPRCTPRRPRRKQSAKFFADAGAYAPTIGIIGTVMGLVHVLENLAQPEELGHLIAGAFVATLWGVMSANVIWLPLGNRLKRLGELEAARMELDHRGRRRASRPAPTRASSPRSCARCCPPTSSDDARRPEHGAPDAGAEPRSPRSTRTTSGGW